MCAIHSFRASVSIGMCIHYKWCLSCEFIELSSPCWCDIRFNGGGDQRHAWSLMSPSVNVAFLTQSFLWIHPEHNYIWKAKQDWRIYRSVLYQHYPSVFIFLSGFPITDGFFFATTPGIFFLYLFSDPSAYLPYHAAKPSIYTSICLSNNMVLSICLTIFSVYLPHCQSKLFHNRAYFLLSGLVLVGLWFMCPSSTCACLITDDTSLSLALKC